MWTQSKGWSEVEDMDTSDMSVMTEDYKTNPWHWFYLDEKGAWHMFENDRMEGNSLTSEDIERYYTRNPKGVLQISTSRGINKLDFADMVLTDIKTRKQRRIKRSNKTRETGNSGRCSCVSSVPTHWEAVDPKNPYQVFCLKRDTAEYKYVAGCLKKGELDRRIKSICRIQNLDLWELYCRKKIQLGRIQGVTEVKEEKLFHGTQVSNVHSICTYNFDNRLAGINGHVLGKGTYFARFASYADNYSPVNIDPVPLFGEAPQAFSSQNTKTMFLCKVIVGKTTLGKKDFLKPDDKSAINFHDSCVDNVMYPNIFVIFDPNQIYPEYLIQYY
uniref:Poly [ADP-ribose] polymerase n=1 Tax=Hucho hucho TaxID=62062 RepID=A0A4W5R3J2_9TELE